MAPPNEFKEGTIPCGSPNCIAVTLEDLLSKQTENLNVSLTKLIDVNMKGISDLFTKTVQSWDRNYDRLESKHDRELAEVFLRLGKVEGIAQVVKSRQVGLPKCQKEMAETEGRINLLENCIFTTEQKSKILDGILSKEERDAVVMIVEEQKKQSSFRQAVKVGIVILIVMGVLKFGLDIYYHVQQGEIIKINKQASEVVNE